MQELASEIRDRLDTLAAEYGQRLETDPRTSGGYADMPREARLEAARNALQLVAVGLETGDESPFSQFVEGIAVERVAQGIEIDSVQGAVTILAEVVEPMLPTVETANFLWRMVVQVHGILSRATLDRMRAVEEALRDSEELFRSVVDNSTAGIFTVNENYQFVYANDQLCDLIGYPREEVIGQNFQVFLDAESQQLVAERYVRRQRGEDVPSRYEFNIVRKDGEKRRVEISSVVIRDPGGNVRTVAQLTDITERKHAEEALRRSEERYRALFAQASDAIFVQNERDEIVDVNIRACELLGYSREELLAMKGSDLQAPQVRGGDGDADERELELYDGTPFESVRLDRGGTRIPVEISTTRLSGEGGLVLSILRDIRERKEMEQSFRESLERRGRQVQTVTEIAQEIATAPALDELYRRVVTLVKERFDFYHAQLFLLNPEGDRLATVAGYGEAGRRLFEQGHFIRVGEGVVGRAGASGQPVLSPDVGRDPKWLFHPLLPETKGELSVPILLHGQVQGVLDVQSDRAGALTEEDQLLLEGLCGQIATAIESTRLRQETEESLRELERLYRTMSREGWDILRHERGSIGYLFDRIEIAPADDLWVPEMGLVAARTGEEGGVPGLLVPPAAGKAEASEAPASGTAVVAPMAVHGEILGALGVRYDAENPLSPDDLALIESVAEQVAQALESARLFDEQQRARGLLGMRVKELDCLNDIGRKIDEGPSIPDLLGWVAGRIPEAMQYPDLCRVAVEFEGEIYGTAEAVALPQQMVQNLRLGGQQAGRVCIAYIEARDFMDEESALMGDVARRVSGYIENRRLFDQTQATLAETEALYRAIADLNTARTYEEILDVLRQYTLLGEADRSVSVSLFDRPWTGDSSPEWITATARWSRLPMADDLRYRLRDFPSASSLLSRSAPTLVTDVRTDPRMDENARALYFERYGVRSTIAVPLVVAGRWIGYVDGLYTEQTEFPEADVRRLTALVAQAAVVIQGLRQLEETQARAERERQVRSIADRVRGRASREDTLRVALQELRQMLGASEAVIRLGTREQLLPEEETAAERTPGG